MFGCPQVGEATCATGIRAVAGGAVDREQAATDFLRFGIAGDLRESLVRELV